MQCTMREDAKGQRVKIFDSQIREAGLLVGLRLCLAGLGLVSGWCRHERQPKRQGWVVRSAAWREVGWLGD